MLLVGGKYSCCSVRPLSTRNWWEPVLKAAETARARHMRTTQRMAPDQRADVPGLSCLKGARRTAATLTSPVYLPPAWRRLPAR